VSTREGVGTPSDIRKQLICFLNEIAEIPKDRITDQATVDEQLQMTSIAFVELQVAIEEEYNIQIDPIRIVELNRFGEIVDYVYQCVAGRAE